MDTELSQKELAASFMALFAGLDRAYGLYTVSETTAKGKRIGRPKGDIDTKRAPVTVTLWENHVAGIQGIGIVPIRDGNGCVFGAIDIDEYGIDHRALLLTLKKIDVPVVVCRSKSGGAHLYLFSKEEVPATTMRRKLLEIATYLRRPNAEIFPKQEELADKRDVGQWINMPYFGGVMGMRYAVKDSGDAYSPEEFLALAEKSKVPASWFQVNVSTSNDFEDGPPCLQTIASGGIPDGMRNDTLTQIGIYLKKVDKDGWETMMYDFNARLVQPPLDDREVKEIARSLKKKDYNYACKREPLKSCCNASLCRTRPYGVGSGGSGFTIPKFGDLTKLKTVPPIWFWTIDGKRVQLTTSELYDSSLFSKACLDQLSVIVPVISKINWMQLVDNALKKLIEIDAPEDASPEGMFLELLAKFCTGRAQALSLQEISLGKPFTDKEAKRTYFRLSDLNAFLTRNKFSEIKTEGVVKVLQEQGAEHASLRSRGQRLLYWVMPSFDFDDESKLDIPEDLTKDQAPF